MTAPHRRRVIDAGVESLLVWPLTRAAIRRLRGNPARASSCRARGRASMAPALMIKPEGVRRTVELGLSADQRELLREILRECAVVGGGHRQVHPWSRALPWSSASTARSTARFRTRPLRHVLMQYQLAAETDCRTAH